MAMKWSGSSLHESKPIGTETFMPTRNRKKKLEALAAMPDETIDFSDIPEITDRQWTVPFVGLFARPETRHISIRLSAVDLVIRKQTCRCPKGFRIRRTSRVCCMNRW